MDSVINTLKAMWNRDKKTAVVFHIEDYEAVNPTIKKPTVPEHIETHNKPTVPQPIGTARNTTQGMGGELSYKSVSNLDHFETSSSAKVESCFAQTPTPQQSPTNYIRRGNWPNLPSGGLKGGLPGGAGQRNLDALNKKSSSKSFAPGKAISKPVPEKLGSISTLDNFQDTAKASSPQDAKPVPPEDNSKKDTSIPVPTKITPKPLTTINTILSVPSHDTSKSDPSKESCNPVPTINTAKSDLTKITLKPLPKQSIAMSVPAENPYCSIADEGIFNPVSSKDISRLITSRMMIPLSSVGFVIGRMGANIRYRRK